MTPAGWGKCRAGGGIAGQIVIKLVHTIRRVLQAPGQIQPAYIGHGQSQQIGIADLARTKDSFPANQTFLEQADLLGPEGRAGMAAGLGQTGGHLLGVARIQMPSRSRN
jgi:hypothetical protein